MIRKSFRDILMEMFERLAGRPEDFWFFLFGLAVIFVGVLAALVGILYMLLATLSEWGVL